MSDTGDNYHKVWRCTNCGAVGPEMDQDWRWDGEQWQHKCPGSGQAGHSLAEVVEQ